MYKRREIMKRIELLDALRKVMPGIGEKNILLEGADSFMFDGGWLKTYNDSISVSYPFNSGIKCLVKAQELFKLLNLLETDEVKILILSDGKFQLSSGNTTLKTIVLSSEVFPLWLTIWLWIRYLGLSFLRIFQKPYLSVLNLLRLPVYILPCAEFH